LPALGMALAFPFAVLGYNTLSFSSGAMAIWLAIPALAIAALLRYTYLGPMFAVTQKLVEPRMRATAAALLLFVVNFIGYVFGPPVVGIFSDTASRIHLAQIEAPLSLTECDAVDAKLKATADNTAGALSGTALQEAETQYADYCAPARRVGIRWAVTLGSAFFLWAALHFLLLGRTMKRDLWTPDAA